MKRDNVENHAVLWGWLGVMGLAAGVAAFPPENSGDVASWVQGIGTIAAVGVTMWVSLEPARERVRDLREAKADLARELEDILDMAAPAMAQFSQALEASNASDAMQAIRGLERLSISSDLEFALNSPLRIWPSGARTYARAILKLLSGLRPSDWQARLIGDQALAREEWFAQGQRFVAVYQNAALGLQQALHRT